METSGAFENTLAAMRTQSFLKAPKIPRETLLCTRLELPTAMSLDYDTTILPLWELTVSDCLIDLTGIILENGCVKSVPKTMTYPIPVADTPFMTRRRWLSQLMSWMRRSMARPLLYNSSEQKLVRRKPSIGGVALAVVTLFAAWSPFPSNRRKLPLNNQRRADANNEKCSLK